MVKLSGRRVYLDTSTVIYALEQNKQFANLKTGLLDLMDTGLITAVTSEITLIETIVGPRKAGDIDTEAKFRVFLTPSANFLMPPLTMAVIEKVIDLRAQYGFKTPDAVHLATGILAGCDLFVTGDQAWNRAGVTVVDPANVA